MYKERILLMPIYCVKVTAVGYKYPERQKHRSTAIMSDHGETETTTLDRCFMKAHQQRDSCTLTRNTRGSLSLSLCKNRQHHQDC